MPASQKGPVLKGWQHLRISADQAVHHFNSCGNIGILLGEPSGGLVDVDLDCAEAVKLAEQFLPTTDAVTGRPSRPRSHRWYIAPGLRINQFRDPFTDDMILEVRGTGGQTLVGPSVHPEGERYDMLDDDPAAVEPEELVAAARALAVAVLRQRYPEVPISDDVFESDGVSGAPATVAPAITSRMPVPDRDVARASAYLAKMPGAVSGSGGHGRTYAAAVVLVHGFCLAPEQAMTMLRDEYNPRCEPPWSERELWHKVNDAATKAHSRPYGWLRDSGGARGERRDVRRGSERADDVGQAAECGDNAPQVARATILLRTDEHEVVNEAVMALAAEPSVYQRGNRLVRVLEAGEGERPTPGKRTAARRVIAPLPQPTLRELLTKHAEFQIMNKKGVAVPAHPSQWLVSQVESRGDWPGIRHLDGLSDTPVLRPDGSMWQRAGYDSVTGVLYSPVTNYPPVPEDPSEAEVAAAVGLLGEIVSDFPFEAPEHRSAWIAALLTPLARTAFDGPAPLFLIDANSRGAGKTLLVKILGELILGHEIPASTYPGDPEELRKQVTSIAITGDRMMLLDNISGRFGDAVLDACLTTTRWKARMLGTNDQVDLPLKTVWYATGNNVQVAADTGRRIIHIRIEAMTERPEERCDFKHPDLLGWVRENRGSIVAAALTIMSAYIRARDLVGKPTNLKPMGSFEGWSDLVRAAIVWVGLPDPYATRDKLAVFADSVDDCLEQLIMAIRAYDPHGKGFVIQRALADLYGTSGGTPKVDAAAINLRTALESLTGCPAGKTVGARQIAAKLKGFRRRVVGGFYLDFNPAAKTRDGTVWLVLDATPVRLCDSASQNPAPSREEDDLPI